MIYINVFKHFSLLILQYFCYIFLQGDIVNGIADAVSGDSNYDSPPYTVEGTFSVGGDSVSIYTTIPPSMSVHLFVIPFVCSLFRLSEKFLVP